MTANKKHIFNKFCCYLLVVIFIQSFLVVSSSFSADKVFFYHTDAAGTPTAMTDAGGTVVWEADYLPFGEEYAITASAANKQRFVGKEKDEETDLYYFGARYLDARNGRFTKPDPVGPVDPWTSSANHLLLVNPQRLNRFSYSLNNPYKYIDSNGEMATEIAAGVGTVIAPGPGTVGGALIGGAIDVAIGMVGGYVVYKAGEAIMNSKEEDAGPKEGSAGGPGAGKRFTDKVKDAAEKQADGKCVFCGEKTTREPGPKQRNTDHADPKSRGGNNTLDNAQNTCRNCNFDKRTKTTKEYLDSR